MKLLIRSLMFALALLLAACAAPPESRYFSLQVPSEAPQKQLLATESLLAIYLRPVTLPAQVDRPQIVIAVPGSDTLILLNESVWAAPLADEIRQALSLSLRDQLNALLIDDVRALDGLEVWKIAVTINRFEMRNGDGATLDATWRLTPSGEENHVKVCSAQAEQAVKQIGVEPLIKAQKKLLQHLSLAIAASVQDIGIQNSRCSVAAPSKQ